MERCGRIDGWIKSLLLVSNDQIFSQIFWHNRAWVYWHQKRLSMAVRGHITWHPTHATWPAWFVHPSWKFGRLKAAYDWWVNYENQSWEWTDCCSVLKMRQNGGNVRPSRGETSTNINYHIQDRCLFGRSKSGFQLYQKCTNYTTDWSSFSKIVPLRLTTNRDCLQLVRMSQSPRSETQTL